MKSFKTTPNQVNGQIKVIKILHIKQVYKSVVRESHSEFSIYGCPMKIALNVHDEGY